MKIEADILFPSSPDDAADHGTDELLQWVTAAEHDRHRLD